MDRHPSINCDPSLPFRRSFFVARPFPSLRMPSYTQARKAPPAPSSSSSIYTRRSLPSPVCLPTCASSRPRGWVG